MKLGPTITGVPESTDATKTAKVIFRVSPADKDLIRRAAKSEDLDEAAFARRAALQRARETVEKDGKPVEIKS